MTVIILKFIWELSIHEIDYIFAKSIKDHKKLLNTLDVN